MCEFLSELYSFPGCLSVTFNSKPLICQSPLLVYNYLRSVMVAPFSAIFLPSIIGILLSITVRTVEERPQ